MKAFIFIMMLLPVFTEAAELPRQYGSFRLGMSVSDAAIVTGIPEEDFDGTCASCSKGENEVSVSPKLFPFFSEVFPGLVVDTWMPNDAVILLTTKQRVTGFVIHYDNKVKHPSEILAKRLGKPKLVKGDGFITQRWADSRTVIEHDFETIRIYDRRYYPKF